MPKKLIKVISVLIIILGIIVFCLIYQHGATTPLSCEDANMEQECITELEESLLSLSKHVDEGSKQIKILFEDKNCTSDRCDDEGKCEPCTDDGECPRDCKIKSECFSYEHHDYDACGGTSMKSNVAMKGYPAGSVWVHNFCDPDGSLPYYSVPKNIACEKITPKKVMKDTTYKSRFE